MNQEKHVVDVVFEAFDGSVVSNEVWEAARCTQRGGFIDNTKRGEYSTNEGGLFRHTQQIKPHDRAVVSNEGWEAARCRVIGTLLPNNQCQRRTCYALCLIRYSTLHQGGSVPSLLLI